MNQVEIGVERRVEDRHDVVARQREHTVAAEALQRSRHHAGAAASVAALAFDVIEGKAPALHRGFSFQHGITGPMVFRRQRIWAIPDRKDIAPWPPPPTLPLLLTAFATVIAPCWRAPS